MKIYIDSDFRCHTIPNENLREFDVPFFDDKCTTLIEGYRQVPPGERLIREDGEVFKGEMIAPAVDYETLGIAQLQYENQDMKNSLSILLGGGTV